MHNEIPNADRYLLQYQMAERKDTGEWQTDRVTKSRQYASHYLDNCGTDHARRVVPMEEFPAEAVQVSGTVYDFPTHGEYEAGAI